MRTTPKFPCPACGCMRSRVMEGRPFKRRDGFFRRRVCVACGTQFTTEEQIKAVYPSGAPKRDLPYQM